MRHKSLVLEFITDLLNVGYSVQSMLLILKGMINYYISKIILSRFQFKQVIVRYLIKIKYIKTFIIIYNKKRVKDAKF